MNEVFKAVKVSEHVYWVGAIDWGIRDFHGYLTGHGTTYNAYLVIADKVILIDTVKAPFRDEMLRRIASIIDPRDINYIISNHSEMDHSGCLPEIVDQVKPEKVFASVMGVKALTEHFHKDWEIVAVKDGESLTLGNINLAFMETRMLHWPDSMFTYLAEDSFLFSQDAFGMHLASFERFADEIDDALLLNEASRYYANILLPFSSFVTRLFEKVDTLDITIETIAPDHGPIWRKDIQKILSLYAEWADRKLKRKAVIVFDTMWQSTALMARAIGEGLAASGIETKLMPLKSCHRSDVAAEILDAGALLVGSPTINNTMFPSVSDILTYLKGLKPRNLIGAAFGSYGWSGEAAKQMNDILDDMKLNVIEETLRIQYVPDDDALKQCFMFGVLIANKIKENVHNTL